MLDWQVARRAFSRDFLENREQDGSENRYDGDDDEQFNQGEAA